MRPQSRTPRDEALARLAMRQWGVVSVAQLRALGFSAGAIKHRARVGRLHPVYRGVYAVGHPVLRREGRWLAAVLACGPGAVLSHRSAAAHWGLLDSDQARTEVSAPATRHGPAGVRLHRRRSLDGRDTVIHEGIPITTIARTLLDLAATVRPDRLERAFAQALHLRVYDHRAITELLARTHGHRGRAALQQTTARDPKLTKNRFEARLLALVRDAGLPEPLVNHVLDALDHGRCEVDFYWPTHHLIVETDGWQTHGTRAAFEADRAQDAALTAAGYRVLRFTWWTRPEVAVRRLRALLHH